MGSQLWQRVCVHRLGLGPRLKVGGTDRAACKFGRSAVVPKSLALTDLACILYTEHHVNHEINVMLLEGGICAGVLFLSSKRPSSLTAHLNKLSTRGLKAKINGSPSPCRK